MLHFRSFSANRKVVVSSKRISQLYVVWFPLKRNWRFCLVAQDLLCPEMFLHERLHGGIMIFFSFLFLYQVFFIVFKHLRLQHRKSDVCILLVLFPTWYLTKICAAHVFVVLGDDIEQGNLIMFYLCFTNDICHNSKTQWNY